MMKKFFFIIAIIFSFNVYLFSQENRVADIIYTFEEGDNDFQIGEWSSPFGKTYGRLIDVKNYNQFIFDDFPNNRFLFFDLKFNFIESVATDLSSKNLLSYVDFKGNYYSLNFRNYSANFYKIIKKNH